MRATWVWVMMASVPSAGLLAVAAPVGDDPPPVTKKDLQISSNNLKQIGLAFHNFNDATGALPNNVTDKDGKALLSWRVQILPYIEEDKLYKEFKLNEPWDSDNNKKLIARMPKVYAPVRVKAKEGETFYQVFTGEKALFGPKKKPRIPASIPDGTSITGMVFEAGDPVIWTKPDDLAFDDKKALPKLGGLFDGDSQVALCDGSVKTIKKGADEAELKKFIMPADGVPIDFTKIEKK